jgi:archaellum component FlaC
LDNIKKQLDKSHSLDSVDITVKELKNTVNTMKNSLDNVHHTIHQVHDTITNELDITDSNFLGNIRGYITGGNKK